MNSEYLNYFVGIWLKFFFLLTPSFVLSIFLAMTKNETPRARRVLSFRVTLAVLATCFVLYFFGSRIFAIFGITLDSFRIGAGALLFLSAARMVRGEGDEPVSDPHRDIAVVPLAIPVTVGPATTGALLVMGAEVSAGWQVAVGCSALAAAVVSVGAILFSAASIEHVIGRRGITILSKLTGLVLAALAAQLVFTGVRNFLGLAH